jgi:hypothetical protein
MKPSGFDEELTAPAGREESAGRTVQLSTLMLLIALIAVCLGVLHEEPGLGILLIILLIFLVIPALARTIAGTRRRQALGRSMSWDEKMLAFFGSLGIVAVIGLAATIAFAATCTPTAIVAASAMDVYGLIPAGLVGLTASGFVIFYLGRALWRQKDL